MAASARRTALASASAASFVLRSFARRSSAIRLLLDVDEDADKSEDDGAEAPTAADSETVLRVDVDEADIVKVKQHVTSKKNMPAAVVNCCRELEPKFVARLLGSTPRCVHQLASLEVNHLRRSSD